MELPALHAQHAVFDNPEPWSRAAGGYVHRCGFRVPRWLGWRLIATACTWSAVFAQQRVDRPDHHAYDPATNQWQELAQLPRGVKRAINESFTLA